MTFERLLIDQATKTREHYGWSSPIFPAQEMVEVTIVWHRGSMIKRDLDNIWKAILDCLTEAGYWEDDQQVTAQIGHMRFDASSKEDEWLTIYIRNDPWAAEPRWTKHHQAKERSRQRNLHKAMNLIAKPLRRPRKREKPLPTD